MNGEKNTNGVNKPNQTQNKGNKRNKTQQKQPLSPQMEERRRRALAIRRQRREAFLARLILCVAIYFAFCMAIGGYVLSMYRGSTVGSNATAIHIADSKGDTVYKLPAAKANINGVEYISASALSKLYKFTLAGDKKQVTLHFHNISQTLSLYKDSSVVEMNGEKIRLSAKIFFTDDYYIPLELIENYFNGAMIDRGGRSIKLSQNNEVVFSLRLHLPQITASA